MRLRQAAADADGHGSAFAFFAVAAVCFLTGCSSTTNSSHVVPGSPIQHVVVIMQENRTFDNLFNGFPGADSAQSGSNMGQVVPLTPVPLATPYDLDHTHIAWWNAWDNGKMDGFGVAQVAPNPPLYAYSYVPKSELQPYWTLASQYTLGDRMFQSNTGPSFVAHQYMIAGQSGDSDENPSEGLWGCDAPPGSTVALIGPDGTDLPGVFPCFDYKTMADLLDAEGITWRYYAPATNVDPGPAWSAYEAIHHIYFGSDWSKNVISPQTQVLTDIAHGHLATVTWIVPDYAHSDHAGSYGSNEGPSWVASIVNAIGASSFWNSTAIFISWDDWGGWYDHVPPQEIDNMGPGFRVPLIVVSPYAKRGYVSHQVYETASLLTYMEKNYGLPNLGTRDANANDLSDCFDYSQTPAKYAPIPTSVTVDRLLHEKNSGPPDDD
ncbi:MAG: alkaline phosphatase family protein [Terracidiphilus sp.]|jgi:phospholipase C